MIFPCPLCHATATQDFFKRTDKSFGIRHYLKCTHCSLIFLSPNLRLSPDQEKARYQNHQNSPNQLGYVKHLKKLTQPLLKKIKPNSSGLDFGCGLGPAIQNILTDFNIKLYDPFFYSEPDLLNRQYDFITCTEVAEHFYNPHQEFKLLHSLLKPESSFLGIMTQRLKNENEFKNWWYHLDPTHVCFYQQKTFDWIGAWLNMKPEYLGDDVVIFENFCHPRKAR